MKVLKPSIFMSGSVISNTFPASRSINRTDSSSKSSDISTNTGITILEDKRNKDATVYDLGGRKVTRKDTLSKGVYIVNGKKIIVK